MRAKPILLSRVVPLLVPLTALLAISACSKPVAPDPEQPPVPQAAHGELHQAIHEPLDKGKAVENATREAAEAQRAAIEAAGG